MRLYTVYRAGKLELKEDPNTWFPTLTTRQQKNMVREQMYYLKQGTATKVVLEEVP